MMSIVDPEYINIHRRQKIYKKRFHCKSMQQQRIANLPIEISYPAKRKTFDISSIKKKSSFFMESKCLQRMFSSGTKESPRHLDDVDDGDRYDDNIGSQRDIVQISRPKVRVDGHLVDDDLNSTSCREHDVLREVRN